jgi:hypothetical protein
VKKRLFILAFLPVSVAFSEEFAVPDLSGGLCIPSVSVQSAPDLFSSLSANPATLHFVTDPVGTLSFEVTDLDGAYRKVTDARSARSKAIHSEGYQIKGPITFYGFFDYRLSTEKVRKWDDVLFATEGNPFVFGDSIAGDYETETFLLKGGLASLFPDQRFAWGLEVSYLAGTSADQTDPRALINGTRYSLKPGFIFRNEHWMYGLDLKEERYRESIGMTVVDNTGTHHYFLFMGMGVYNLASGDSYSRIYEGNNFSAHLQMNRFGKEKDLLLNVGWETVKEVANDGSASNLFKGGDYTKNSFSFGAVGRFGKNKKNTHLVKLTGDFSSAKGLWYDQNALTDSNGDHFWQVYNQSIRFRERAFHSGAEYTFVHGQGSVREGKAGASVQFEQDRTDSYPEGYFIRYTNLEMGVNGSKSMPFFLKSNLSGGFECRYRYNLSQQAKTSGIKFESVLTQPDFHYVTTDRLSGNVFCQIGRNIRQKKDQAIYGFLKAAVDVKSSLDDAYYADNQRTTKTLTLGFIF